MCQVREQCVREVYQVTAVTVALHRGYRGVTAALQHLITLPVTMYVPNKLSHNTLHPLQSRYIDVTATLQCRLHRPNKVLVPGEQGVSCDEKSRDLSSVDLVDSVIWGA